MVRYVLLEIHMKVIRLYCTSGCLTVDRLRGHRFRERSLLSSTPQPLLLFLVLHPGVDGLSWRPPSAPASTPAPGTSSVSACMSLRLCCNSGQNRVSCFESVWWQKKYTHKKQFYYIFTCGLVPDGPSGLRCPFSVKNCLEELCLLSHGPKPISSSGPVP